MKIANGLAMLELPVELMGTASTLNPTLIWDEESAILIDASIPGQAETIVSAMEEAGVPLEKLKAVILTHQDIDHIGSLPELLAKAEHSIKVYAHEMDKPYIEGTLPLIKANRERMGEAFDQLPEAIQRIFLHPPKANVDQVLADGEILPFFGGIEVIHTPGHTPGHIALYVKSSKTLIAGDALMLVEGNLKGPVEQTTPDMKTAYESLNKFSNYDIEGVICYHGGYTSDHVKEQLQALAEQSFEGTK